MPSPKHLVHSALVAVHGVHHVLEDRIEELLGGFGVEAGEEFRGIFEVGKQHGDLLAFAFQRAAGGQDFLGEIGWGVGEGGQRWGRGCQQSSGAHLHPQSRPTRRRPHRPRAAGP